MKLNCIYSWCFYNKILWKTIKSFSGSKVEFKISSDEFQYWKESLWYSRLFRTKRIQGSDLCGRGRGYGMKRKLSGVSYYSSRPKKLQNTIWYIFALQKWIEKWFLITFVVSFVNYYESYFNTVNLAVICTVAIQRAL